MLEQRKKKERKRKKHTHIRKCMVKEMTPPNETLVQRLKKMLLTQMIQNNW